MTRFWNEAIAALGDITPGGVVGAIFISFVLALIVGLLWYLWPFNFGRGSGRRSTKDRRTGTGWRGRFRLGKLRWRLRWRWRRRRADEEAPADLPADELPDLPAEVLVLTADQLAAQGRYAEAVRERMRAMVRDLIERGLIPFSPGWTVTELAREAQRKLPALDPPLQGAVATFSEIWYGLRPAHAGDDQAMRAHAEQLRQLLQSAPVPVAS